MKTDPPFGFFASIAVNYKTPIYLVDTLLPLHGGEVRRDAVAPPQLPRNAPATITITITITITEGGRRRLADRAGNK